MKWAAHVPDDQLPKILLEAHKDWAIKWLRWVPRKWTAWVGSFPVKIFGNAKEVLFTGPNYSIFAPKPIPDPGEWWFGSPVYFAWHMKNGWYIRAGFRWDNNDNYFTLSFTVKRYA